MTRAMTGEQIVIRPSNNIYTALAAVGVLAQALGLAAIIFSAMANDLKLF